MAFLLTLKGSVNPEIVKNIASCNFLIITLMYIKYTFLEWNWVRESVFDIKFYQKWWFFEKMAENHFFGKKKLWQAKKIILS